MIDNFKHARVIVVGDVMLDRYWWGGVTRISPEAPVPVINLERTTSKPGGAANVALNVASLGATVTLLSAIGDDAEGSELTTSLSARGVSPDSLIRVPTRRTSVKTRIIAHSQQVARVDSEHAVPIASETSNLLVQALIDVISEADCVVISDYAKGVLTEELLGAAIEQAKSFRKPVLVDPKGKYYAKYAGATILTPNRREATEACKLEESDPNAVRKAGETLLSECDLRYVLVTEGESGMTLFEEGVEPFHLEASVHQVYDVTGAGDSVIACLGVAMAAGLGIHEACKLANLAGGLSVQQVGTHAVTNRELREELERISR